MAFTIDVHQHILPDFLLRSDERDGSSGRWRGAGALVEGVGFVLLMVASIRYLDHFMKIGGHRYFRQRG